MQFRDHFKEKDKTLQTIVSNCPSWTPVHRPPFSKSWSRSPRRCRTRSSGWTPSIRRRLSHH